jgi:NAD(P)-dependent dehydrogenase (short-subunit alcohol dehydrogenase family)
MAVVLITGCSSGFGEALARGFADRGDAVVATMRRPEASDRWRALVAGDGPVSALALDVTDAGSRERAVEHVLARHGRIDVLVNNAGILHLGSVEDTPEAVMRQVFETNYFGPVALSNAVLPAMRQEGSGRIVNVTAIGALLCTPFLGAYCASKHALDAVSASMDIEVRPLGLRVCSVLPGSFRTAIGSGTETAQDSPPYKAHAEAFRAGFRSRLEQAPDSFRELVDAVVHAATAPDPRPRYVVGGGAADSIRPLVDELAGLHQVEIDRAGPARS